MKVGDKMEDENEGFASFGDAATMSDEKARLSPVLNEAEDALIEAGYDVIEASLALTPEGQILVSLVATYG